MERPHAEALSARRGRRTFLVRAGALGLASLAPSLSAQGGYPNKTIKIIAPVQPGGGVDLVARTIADRLGRALGQSIVVENHERRRRRRGLARDRARGARRLHADGGLRRHARHQSGGAQAALRRDPRFHAHRDGRRHAERARRRRRRCRSRRCASSSPTRRRIPASCRTARRARARSRTSRWSS